LRPFRPVLINRLYYRRVSEKDSRLMSNHKVHDQPSGERPGCEVSKTLQGGHCEFEGEVAFDGLLLCERHARWLETQDRVDLLSGIVSSLELSLRSITLRRNTNLTLLLRAKRAEASRELARAQVDLRQADEDVS
jgi:hypothetical protein